MQVADGRRVRGETPSVTPKANPLAHSRDRLDLRRIGVTVAGLLLAVYATYIFFHPFGDRYNWFFDNVVTDVILALPAAACIHRAAVSRRARFAWATIGVALAIETLADVYWNAIIAPQANPPYPSVADFLYLAFYPAMALGLMAAALHGRRRIRASLWLHVLIAMLTIAALDSAIVFDALAPSGGGSGWEYAVNLAYPLGDVLLLSGVAGIWALSGWRPNATWVWFGAGMLVFAAGDSAYLYQSMKSTYAVGGLVDLSWPMAAVLMTIAATRRSDTSVQTRIKSGHWLFLPTAIFSTASVAILGWDHFHHVGDLAMILALSASILTIVQLGIAFAENYRLMARSERNALIDDVTGLANRRKLFIDLRAACERATTEHPIVLALFDLDGFKSINDSHGHAAGDDLLDRFAERLRQVAAPYGEAYRLGGDEFCVVLHMSGEAAAPLLKSAAALLSEHGDGFTVTSSYGCATVPAESRDPDDALKIADLRMYRAKRGATPRVASV